MKLLIWLLDMQTAVLPKCLQPSFLTNHKVQTSDVTGGSSIESLNVFSICYFT